MRLWTIQGIEIYEQLLREGIAYCTKPTWGNDTAFMYAYHWMANQMRERIGEPPIKEIIYPMWAWYQYNSAKSKKPPKSFVNIPEGKSAYLEIEIPAHDVLLSGFGNWHAVLNQCALSDWKTIDKKTDLLDKAAGRRLDFNEYPVEIKKEIEKSWEAVFDLDRRDREVGFRHKRNRSIQATFWMLKLEHIISVELLDRNGNLIKKLKEDSCENHLGRQISKER